MAQRTRSTSDTRLLTATEVGARLRLPLSTVYYLAKQGKLRGFRVGRSWRFPEAEIRRLLDADGPLVLIVDDQQATRDLVAMALEPSGCSVREAGSVREALEMAQRTRFDVLLVDLKLPDGDGTELIRELAGSYGLEQMVLISELSELASGAAWHDVGGVTLLPRPLSREGIAACVKRIAMGRPANRERT